MTTESEITRLANVYHRTVCLDHHKDSDCHWEITQRWSYGEEPKWLVKHDGYIRNAEKSFNSYESALAGLKDYLEGIIRISGTWI